MHRCYEDTIKKIRDYVADKSIFVSIEETSDEVGRSIANVIVGTLEEDKPGKIFGSLAYINSNFSHLVTSLNYLEKRNETIHSILSKVSDVQQQLEQCEGEIGNAVNKKMKLVLEKNPGYQIMCR